MGIRDWINKRKAKKQAEQLANVDTSSGGKKENLYVDIDKVNTNTGNDYSYDAGDAQVYVKGGGGGYTPVTVEPKTSQNQIQIQEQNQIQIQEQTKQDLLNQNQKNKIDILRSGAVRQLDERGRYREYVGQAIVGDTGKTANQLQKELRDEYKKQTGKVVGQGKLSGTLYTSTPEEIAESLPEQVNLIQQVKEETKTFSFYNYPKQVPVSDIKNPFSYVRIQADTISEATGKGVSNLIYKADKGSVGKEITYYEPQFGTIGEKGSVEKINKIYTEQDRKDFSNLIGDVVTKTSRVGMYFVPVVGGSLFAAEVGELGTDVYQTKKAGEKLSREQKLNLGLTGGIILTAGILRGAKAYTNFKTSWKPKNLKYETQIESLTKAKVRNIPREVQYISKEGSLIRSGSKTGGSQIIYEQFPGKIKTTGKGTRYFEQQIQEVSGNIRGSIERTSILGKYGNKYTTIYEYNPKTNKIEYNIFKNKKLIKEGINIQESNKLFGYLESKPIKYIKKSTKDKGIFIDKVDDLVTLSSKEKVFTNEIILLKDTKNLQIKNQKLLQTSIKQGEKTIITPAEKNIRIKASEGKNILELQANIEKQTAQISTKKYPDKIILREPKVSNIENPIITQASLEMKTPRFKQKIISTTEYSGGSFDLVRTTKVDRFVNRLTEPAITGKGIYYSSLGSPALILSPKVNIPKVNIKPSSIKREFGLVTDFTESTKINFKPVNLKIEEIKVEKIEPDTLKINLEKQKVRTQTSFKINQDLKTRSRKVEKQESFLDQKPIQKEIQKEKQIQKQRQVQKMSELLVEKNKQITEQTPRIIPPNIETPKIKIPKIPIKIKGSKDVKIIKGINEDKFEVFGRRYGKDIKLTSTESEKKATKELEKFLKGTLGASGFVKKGGKKLDINLGAGFRKSKVDSKRVVQKRSQRLKTRSETSEIKSSKKKIRWF